MQSMFDTGKIGNQLVFAEMLQFRAVNFRYHIENRPLLVAQCVYTLSGSCSMAIPKLKKQDVIGALKFIDSYRRERSSRT